MLPGLDPAVAGAGAVLWCAASMNKAELCPHGEYKGLCRQLPDVASLILRDHNQKYVLLTVVTPGIGVLPMTSISFSAGIAVEDLQGTEACH